MPNPPAPDPEGGTLEIADMPKYAMIPEWLICHKGIKSSSKVVYCYLMRRSIEKGCAWPYRKTIAADTGLSLDTVDRCIQELYDHGILKVQQRMINGHRTSNLYTLVFQEPQTEPHIAAANCGRGGRKLREGVAANCGRGGRKIPPMEEESVKDSQFEEGESPRFGQSSENMPKASHEPQTRPKPADYFEALVKLGWRTLDPSEGVIAVKILAALAQPPTMDEWLSVAQWLQTFPATKWPHARTAKHSILEFTRIFRELEDRMIADTPQNQELYNQCRTLAQSSSVPRTGSSSAPSGSDSRPHAINPA
jgi:hypothetical protein